VEDRRQSRWSEWTKANRNWILNRYITPGLGTMSIMEVSPTDIQALKIRAAKGEQIVANRASRDREAHNRAHERCPLLALQRPRKRRNAFGGHDFGHQGAVR
jgi:hypothetical protein